MFLLINVLQARYKAKRVFAVFGVPLWPPLPCSSLVWVFSAILYPHLLSLFNVLQARNNTNRVFAVFGVYVVASSALFHGAKALIKGLFRRLPHKGPLQPSLPVVFAADVLLPTAFFGPYLAAYTAIQILLQAAKDKVCWRALPGDIIGLAAARASAGFRLGPDLASYTIRQVLL